MKSPRHRTRELVVQGLYQWLVTQSEPAFVETFIRETPDFHKADEVYFKTLFYGVIKNKEEHELLFAPFLDRPIVELSPVEHAVLLLATYELTYELSVPYKVVINEAIELTKSFGGTDGYKFVNGVLDKVTAKLRSLEINGSASP